MAVIPSDLGDAVHGSWKVCVDRIEIHWYKARTI